MNHYYFSIPIEEIQHNHAIRSAIARRNFEHQKTRPKRSLKTFRLELVETIRKNYDDYVQKVEIDPMGTCIQINRDISRWEENEITPDDLENAHQREELISLYQNMQTLIDRCLSLISSEQVEQMNACLNAMFLQDFILTIAEHLEDYKKYQRAYTTLDQSRFAARLWQRDQYVFPLGASLLTFMVLCMLTSMGTQRMSSMFLVIWFMVSLAVGYLVYKKVKRKRPDETMAAEKVVKQAYDPGWVKYYSFWTAVQEVFNGLPESETLEEIYNSQTAVSSSILGKHMLKYSEVIRDIRK